jgi:exoribonuclease R
MTLYKIIIDNRNYTSWNVVNANTLEPITLDGFSPEKHKLFTNDVFTYNKGKVEITHSSIRFSENIPAVVILDNNKTYGRENYDTHLIKTNKKHSKRLLYKCIPDDTRLPIFLVPYEIKQMGFYKVFTNIYVTIRYKQWDDKHPLANISQTIGSVDILDHFYEYQLYCKSLNTSIQKFNKDTNKNIKSCVKSQEHDTFISGIHKNYPQIEDRTDWKIFTIDPPTSLDYDDGFSIKKLNDNQTLLSIYIANVTIWMDSLNLWSSFSQRISTIYLPDKKRPMLPTILSDCLCSLQQNMRRFAIVIDIILDQNTEIISIKYTNTLIKVFKNFSYEDHSLLNDNDYQFLFDTTKKMSKKYKYINNVKDSHDVVCYLMIFMNYNSAQELLKSHNGIFRSTIINTKLSLPNSLPEDVDTFIKIWNSNCAQYIDLNSIPINELNENDESCKLVKTYNSVRHDLLEMDAYIHITSPIRRLVDLLNMIKLQENKSMINLSAEALLFYDKWIGQLDYINTTMRAIRKVQNECSLLDTCFNKPDTLDKIYDGYCFDKLIRNDGLYQFIVFLPELKLSSKITTRYNLENYEKRQYKLYLFNNEEKFKRKIRLQLI